MRSLSFFILSFILLSLSSCAKCNSCETDASLEEICTNSVLDRSKAKSICKKGGGIWLTLEKQ